MLQNAGFDWDFFSNPYQNAGFDKVLSGNPYQNVEFDRAFLEIPIKMQVLIGPFWKSLSKELK